MTRETASRFVPVAVTSANGPTNPVRKDIGGDAPLVEVVLRNGRVLRLPAGMPAARAAELADALEGLAR